MKRRRFHCGLCRESRYPVDLWLGGESFLSKRLRRLACLLTSERGFARSAECLAEVCGVEVAAETLRVQCERERQRMADWQTTSSTVGEAFVQAVGELAQEDTPERRAPLE